MSSSLISTPKQKGDLYLASSLCDGLEDNDLRQVTTLLKNKDADPNVLMPLHGITPFHLVIGNDSEAFAEEVTKLFLRHGGNPNIKSVDGMTPVHVAAAWGRAKILDLLLANGGDPLCLDLDSCSPFHYAFQGEHFEAVAVLSKYCINTEEDDDKPHFKRELGKVLVNNGDLLAEYMVSDDSSFSNSFKDFSCLSNSYEDSKINTSGYHPENSSKDVLSLNSNFVTMRRKQREKIKQEEIDNLYNNNRNIRNFDFKRETVEEERSLISEIISQLSSSITSEVETNQIYEDEFLSNGKTSSPKRKEITMTFNRPIKCDYYKVPEKQTTNRRSSTLHVIKQHNHLPHLKNTRILTNNLKKSSSSNLDKNLASKKNIQPTTRKVTPSKSKFQNKDNVMQLNKWLDETIISKSPNLAINTHTEEKKKKFFKTPCFEKKSSTKYTKLPQKSPAITPSKIRIKSPNKPNNVTPTSRIPRPKKYFTTPTNAKTVKRSIETPTRTVIPNKRKPESSKVTVTSGKSKNVTPLNRMFNRSEASTSSVPTGLKNSPKTAFKKDNFRNIAVNLDDLMYDNDEEELVKDRIPDSFKIAQSKQPANKYVSTFEKELAKLLPEGEFVSGVGMLDSGATSKSESKLISSINKEDTRLFSQNNDIDFNRAIFDSATSSEESKEDCSNINNLEGKLSDKTNNGYDSLLCSKGSSSPNSNSSDSFLSLSKRDDHPQVDNATKADKDADGILQSISPESNFISLKDDSFSSSDRKIDSETFISVDEEYKYEDREEGVIFLERRLCVSPPCASSDLNTSFYSCSTTRSEPLPKEMFLLDNVTLRERLRNLGENPGPITETTHHLYLKRLYRLETQGRKPTRHNDVRKTYSRGSVNFDNEKELLKSSLLSIEWIKNLDDYEALEQKVFQEFVDPSPSRKWREGTTKSSFNYLLLDPRITKDLPRRAAHLSMSEKWQIFLSAIFYVGKGKRSRPYAHLYDAFKIWVSKDDQNVSNKKIQRILDIWNEDRGVIVLHVFQNTIPVEAYTREAMMIDVLGTQKLGNCKAGDYYGVVSTWRSKEKCELGRYLLFKALQILLLEGERQIFPQNL